MAALKTTSRAEFVYARLEARRAGADDALFLTVDDRLSEATSANLFLVRRAPLDGAVELATPSLDCAILAGTTRSWLLGWAAGAGLRAFEGHLTRHDLASADEAFLCSSVAGVLPVTRFDGAAIGTGSPGPSDSTSNTGSNIGGKNCRESRQRSGDRRASRCPPSESTGRLPRAGG